MKFFFISLLIPLLIISPSNLIGQESLNKLNNVDSLINYSISDTAFPGAVVLVWKDGKVIYDKAFGRFTYDKKSTLVSIHTLYDLASLTKVIGTTTAAMICYDKKLFSLDDPVVKYLPEFGVNGKDKITIKNLMLHNAGLVAWKKFYEYCSSPDEVLNAIYSSNLEYEPGTKTIYSDFGFITLSKIIEKVTGKTLDEFCKDEIFIPLKMNSTYFNPNHSLKKLCAPTEIDNYWRMRALQGEVHDEASSMLNGVAGHAGLFSTADDISKLIAVLMNKGKLNNQQFIQQSTVELFTKRYSEESTRAIGWDTRSETGSSSGDYFSMSSFGHTGFTGTSIWADPEKHFFVIFLTNRVYPTRNNSKLGKVRPLLHNLIYKDLFSE